MVPLTWLHLGRSYCSELPASYREDEEPLQLPIDLPEAPTPSPNWHIGRAGIGCDEVRGTCHSVHRSCEARRLLA